MRSDVLTARKLYRKACDLLLEERLPEAWQAVSAELYKAASEKARAGKAQGQPGGEADRGGDPKEEGKKEEGPIIDAEVVDEKK